MLLFQMLRLRHRHCGSTFVRIMYIPIFVETCDQIDTFFFLLENLVNANIFISLQFITTCRLIQNYFFASNEIISFQAHSGLECSAKFIFSRLQHSNNNSNSTMIGERDTCLEQKSNVSETLMNSNLFEK